MFGRWPLETSPENVDLYNNEQVCSGLVMSVQNDGFRGTLTLFNCSWKINSVSVSNFSKQNKFNEQEK